MTGFPRCNSLAVSIERATFEGSKTGMEETLFDPKAKPIARKHQASAEISISQYSATQNVNASRRGWDTCPGPGYGRSGSCPTSAQSVAKSKGIRRVAFALHLSQLSDFRPPKVPPCPLSSMAHPTSIPYHVSGQMGVGQSDIGTQNEPPGEWNPPPNPVVPLGFISHPYPTYPPHAFLAVRA